MTDSDLASFLTRWQASGGAERANYQLFLAELCDVLEVAHPQPTGNDDSQNAYVFERNVRFDNRDGTHSTGRIDLYKRGCFVCETKQGVQREDEALVLSTKQAERKQSRKKGHGTRGTAAWDDAMFRAVGQAEQYARSLPAEEGRPPFLVVIDVGHTIELYSEFSQTGGYYTPFPDARSHRIRLEQLAEPEIRERLRLVWTDPHALDPARRSAKVTREIAAKLPARVSASRRIVQSCSPSTPSRPNTGDTCGRPTRLRVLSPRSACDIAERRGVGVEKRA